MVEFLMKQVLVAFAKEVTHLGGGFRLGAQKPETKRGSPYMGV